MYTCVCRVFVQVLIKDWVMFAIVGVVVGVEVIILVVGTTVPQIQPTANITYDEERPTSVNVREHCFALWTIYIYIGCSPAVFSYVYVCVFFVVCFLV